MGILGRAPSGTWIAVASAAHQPLAWVPAVDEPEVGAGWLKPSSSWSRWGSLRTWPGSAL